MKNLFILIILSSILLTSCSSTSGTVKGMVCYPSEYIPAMIVYLKNKETGKIYSLDIEENQKPFKFKKIPAGDYIAFAYTVQEDLTDAKDKSTITNGEFSSKGGAGLGFIEIAKTTGNKLEYKFEGLSTGYSLYTFRAVLNLH